MRVWMYACVALIAGISAGLGSTWLEFREVHEYFAPASRTKAGEPADSAAPSGPLAVVMGGTKFDFGTMDHDQTRDRTFVIRNDGNKPLQVSWLDQSCGMCIQNKHNFSDTTVAPGDQCEVIVTYATKKAVTHFSESAYLKTNDPRNSTLQLQITGFVAMAFKLNPESLALSSVSTSEPTSVSAKLFGFQSDKLELIKYELSDPSASGMIEMTAKPLDATAIKAEEHARAGLDLQFQIKPGLPIGPLSQTISLTVKTESEHIVELPMNGSVVGDLSVFGKGYDSNSGTLSMGVINRQVGISGQIFVLVKGPARNDVKLTVAEVDPVNVMQVVIGEPTAVAEGKSIKIPIDITIPKGAPAMNRLGSQQGKAAKLVLETSHPTSKKLSIIIRFAIE